MAKKKVKTSAYVWAVTRISLGFVFLWAFFDKLFGLGFATCRGEDGTVTTLCEKAWIEGGSPTLGFLKFGTANSPFADTFQSMAGNTFVDWLFMLGLLGIGLALVLGIGMKIAAFSAATLMGLMYLAGWQPENNPIMDDHIIYGLVAIGLWQVNDEQVWGLAKWWNKQAIVKQHPILK